MLSGTITGDNEPNSLGTSTIINGNGTVTLTGADYVYIDDSWTPIAGVTLPAGYYPQELDIDVVPLATSPTYGSSPSSVTLEIASTLWVPSGVTGGITQTLAAQSGSVWSSGSGTIAMVGNATITVAVESTPAISSAGGTVGIIDVTENAAGALMAGGNPGLKLTLPPGFTWETPTTGSMLEYMWGTDANNVADLNNITTPLDISNNAGRELDINETGGVTISTILQDQRSGQC